MNPIERFLHRIDAAQQRWTVPAFCYAVVKKFGDDRGSHLAVLITYYGFVSLIPLMLLLSTVLGFVLNGHPDAQRAVVNSALADFPIVGDQLRQNVHSVQGSGFALTVGIVGLLYGALGIAEVLQFVMAQVWNTPGAERPGYFPRLLRGLLLFVALGLGLVISTGSASLVTTTVGGPWAELGGLAVSLLVNIGLYLGCFRILTPPEIRLRRLLPGSLLAGPLWTALQAFGGLLVAHQLRHAGQIYGFFATVIGLLSWLFIAAELAVYSAEVNVVLARRLWPRSLFQPPLTAADKAVLTALATQEQRLPEQRVVVEFTDSPDGDRPESNGASRLEDRGGE